MAEKLDMTLNSQEITWLTLRKNQGRGRVKLVSFPVFFRGGEEQGNPHTADQADSGPLPKGTYYVVDGSVSGSAGGSASGRLGRLWDWISGKDSWFALRRDDGNLKGATDVNDAFRMHPETRGDGHVTFLHRNQFATLRNILFATKKETIPGSKTRYYATLQVA
ncbi:MAG: DUF2778 domain-containing protein [Planctomycetales bacterium]